MVGGVERVREVIYDPVALPLSVLHACMHAFTYPDYPT